MDLANKHIAILLYGIVDERSKKSARALADAGAQVTILSITNTRTTHEGEPFSVRYISPGLPAGSTIAWRPLRIAVNLTKRFLQQSTERQAGRFGANNAIQALAELQPDVIHSVNADTLSAAAQAALELGIPYVYESYEFWPDHALSREVRISTSDREALLEAERSNIGGAAALITVSPFLAQEYKTTYDLESEPSVVFNAPPCIAESGSPAHKPLRVLFLGNLQPERNIGLLLTVAEQVPNLVVTFQGSGSMSDEIIEFARKRNIQAQIVIKKPVAYCDLSTSASEHDIGVICHRAYDRQMQGALPNKFFEYLAGGLGVVASDTIAFRDFPEFETYGQLVDVERDGALAAVLEELSTDPERVASMKVAALQAAQLYCGDAQAEKLISIYESIQEVAR